jgi:UDP-N-acetylmuramate dehydrogenase
MEPAHNAPLAPLTSLAAGGAAELLYTCTTVEQLQDVLTTNQNRPIWVLGYGANVLVSDKGLPGATVQLRTGRIAREAGSTTVICDAGVWWDDLVAYTIQEHLWGLELMSAIPGSVGAAVVGNIAAYGQAIAHTLAWIEVLDTTTAAIKRLEASELGLDYRFSNFQTDAFRQFIIVRAAFDLSRAPTQPVVYQAALDIASELEADLTSLDGRRRAVLETRRRAGSLWDYRRPKDYLHTAGSFFRNPLTTADKAEELMAQDETRRSAELLKKMNMVHGGDQKRVSAAHVLLAAGFQRGQAWGPVRLHPDHILKIENTGGATAQQIYEVAEIIVQTVRTRLDIDLMPEVRFLGDFTA